MKFLIRPLQLVVLVWAVFFLDVFLNAEIKSLGIFPRSVYGLPGIVLAPLLHGNLDHIISNTVTLFVLLLVLRLFYKGIYWQVLAILWLFSGLLIWLFARPLIHIGASALIYALAGFITAIGLFSGRFKSLIIAIAIAIAYGGLIYGVLPADGPVSWEGHLLGAVAGIRQAVGFSHFPKSAVLLVDV